MDQEAEILDDAPERIAPHAYWLAAESAIIWRTRPEGLPYVRESWTDHGKRRGPIAFGGLRVLGWSEIRADVPREDRYVYRRVFWLKSHDPYPEEDWAPAEAVKVNSIRAGVPSTPGRDDASPS